MYYGSKDLINEGSLISSRKLRNNRRDGTRNRVNAILVSDSNQVLDQLTSVGKIVLGESRENFIKGAEVGTRNNR